MTKQKQDYLAECKCLCERVYNKLFGSICCIQTLTQLSHWCWQLRNTVQHIKFAIEINSHNTVHKAT